ncbi:type I-E CRISPR-associated protein Cse2/CasB [Teichococcus cervicalis]|uniref:CRISPR system CASCADE complex protein CasB n=1 Tax=Pseudoroseomonas cervicalis ATCC 49957 TaxID=525371 RepID=D5RPS4_9PROT|nr:type I-E CRISPR-associated protein Cse2/CasB [Pseudoroseomonas cervicalis]EFH10701.1 CRISPR system CASCADE complex protein CasB [Pseudoroseomonas cervicalis ATCC 49957]
MSLSPDAAAAWWHDLQGGEGGRRGKDRAALARLRRCARVAEAMQEPAAFDLFHRCGGRSEEDLPKVALVAAVLSHARENSAPQWVARAIGPESPDKPESARMKPLRFRRLMEAETPDELLTGFRRLLALTGGKANIRDLAWALFFWSEKTRITWTYRYWDAEAPHATAKETAA